MKDPRVDVILANLRIPCIFYLLSTWGGRCTRANASQKKNPNDVIKHVSCAGILSNCELTEDDEIIK